MNRKDLESFFSNFWNFPEEKINDFLNLNNSSIPNFSSIRFYQFLAKLESQFKVRVNNVTEIVTFSDLFNNVA